MPPPRGRIKPMLPLVVSGHGNGFPVLLQPSSLFSAAKAAGFPGGFHRARSAAGWLNREDTGAGNPAAEQRIHIISTQALFLFPQEKRATLSNDSHCDPATTYPSGPFPAKYYQRAEA